VNILKTVLEILEKKMKVKETNSSQTQTENKTEKFYQKLVVE